MLIIVSRYAGIPQKDLLNFVGYCDLASFQKVNPENEILCLENTGQPKSARAFSLSSIF